MVHIKKFQVALKLDEKSVPEKIQFGRHVVTKMTGNPNFGGSTPINPPLADVSTATDELEEAWDERKNVEEGTAVVHEKETAFDGVLTPLGHYVEDVANENPATAKSVIQSAGMEVKAESEPVGDLPAPENMKADFGEEEGSIELDCDKVKGAGYFIWLARDDNVTPETWFHLGDYESITTASKFTWPDLTPGNKYHFKVAAGGPNGRGPWSDPATRRAP